MFKLTVLQQAKQREDGKNAKQLTNGIRRTRRSTKRAAFAGCAFIARQCQAAG